MKNSSVTLLALLDANNRLGQSELHRTMLVKQAFLAETIRPLYNLWRQAFSFVRYQHGPWSEAIFHRLDILIFNGLVDVTFMERRPGRVEARYKITPTGQKVLFQIDAHEIMELAHDLVWALQTVGVAQSSTICKLVYQEAEFARIFSQHNEKGIGPEAKVPLPLITAANNQTFITLATLQEILKPHLNDETKDRTFILPTKEVVKVFLKSLVMQVPHRGHKEDSG